MNPRDLIAPWLTPSYKELLTVAQTPAAGKGLSAREQAPHLLVPERLPEQWRDEATAARSFAEESLPPDFPR